MSSSSHPTEHCKLPALLVTLLEKLNLKTLEEVSEACKDDEIRRSIHLIPWATTALLECFAVRGIENTIISQPTKGRVKLVPSVKISSILWSVTCTIIEGRDFANNALQEQLQLMEDRGSSIVSVQCLSSQEKETRNLSYRLTKFMIISRKTK